MRNVICGIHVWFGCAPEWITAIAGFDLLFDARDWAMARRQADQMLWFIVCEERIERATQLVRCKIATDIEARSVGLRIGERYIDDREVIEL